MPKHKKTLQQKKKMDQKHAVVTTTTTPLSSPSVSLPAYQFVTTHKATSTVSSSPTLVHGLEKTLVVSAVIIALQLAFFFLLTHHMLVLPINVIRY